MKRIIVINLLVMALLTTTLAASYASTASKVLIQAPDVFSKRNINEVERLNSDVEKHFNNISLKEITGGNRLTVANLKQKKGYYCGPASARIVLKYKGRDISQDTLANYMGTTAKNGTYVYKMVEGVNHYLGSSKYKYVLNSQISFGSGLVYSIDKNYPVICHVMTGKLPNYSGYNTGHYLVATGYKYTAVGNSGSDRVYYNDPNNNDDYYGKYYTTWSKMRTAINENAGYYIMAK